MTCVSAGQVFSAVVGALLRPHRPLGGAEVTLPLDLGRPVGVLLGVLDRLPAATDLPQALQASLVPAHGWRPDPDEPGFTAPQLLAALAPLDPARLSPPAGSRPEVPC